MVENMLWLPEQDDPIPDPFDGTVESGQAAMIVTGAIVLDGTERVIRIEDTDEDGATTNGYCRAIAIEQVVR